MFEALTEKLTSVFNANLLHMPAGANNNYLGFTIPYAGDPLNKVNYGWFKIDSYNAGTHTFRVADWGYEQVPNTPIKAGDTVGAAAVPEPTSSALALIAMGAGGLAVYRKRKQEKEA